MHLLAIAFLWLESLSGVVVAIDGSDVIVDLGTESGLPPRAKVQLFRTVEVQHPRTKKRIRDQFFLHAQDVAQVGARLSIVRPPAEVLKELKVGDTVSVLMPEAATPALRPAAGKGAKTDKTDPADKAAPCTDATVRLEKARAEGFRSGYEAGRTEAPAERVPSAPAPAPIEVRHVAPRVLFRKTPAQLAFAVEGPTALRAGWVYYRTQAGADYQRVPLLPAGAGYLRASLPPELLRAHQIEYFAEATVDDESASALPLYASAQRPATVPVAESDPTVAEARARERSEVRLSYQYVDFNKLQGNDRYWVAEGDFLYRWAGIIHSLRVGAGAYDGVGGDRQQIDMNVPGASHAVGFNYGYTEIELQVAASVALLGKVLAGLTPGGLAGGFESKIRIGDERGTNLVFGGQVGPSPIGDLAMAKLTWDVIPRLPMAGTVEVTNQPAASDLGVRMLLDVGWQKYSFFRPTLTLGYAVRAVDHGGPTLGLSSVFTW
ncbi:MAG TPA: hypothetical protein VKN99_03930 [Polyangia bacterium]|nr:hypothetical protein [Polyangia bacterium]